MIHDLAGRQHGVVARAQLLAAGVPAHVVDHRLKAGRLRGLYRAVYRVGPQPGRRERAMAAVLACGEGAVVSHRSAAVLWGLLSRPAGPHPVEISLRRGYREPGPSVLVRRIRSLRRDETTVLDGIPVTIPARTVLDLAATTGEREVERAMAQAERSGLASRTQLQAVLDRHPGRPGTPVLRALLSRVGGPALTRSEAEARLLTLVRRARLPDPEANVRVADVEVDFLWRAARLVIEVDGFAFHSSARAFERDRRRDATLTAAGFRVLRTTWRQIVGEPEALLVRVAQALAR
ncbi:MAG TPA: DUF559 domain-containing protein [Longimicrobiales bacterium]|nr:DUF559 domain-containing protein [Longimicrobiales bacterium]